MELQASSTGIEAFIQFRKHTQLKNYITVLFLKLSLSAADCKEMFKTKFLEKFLKSINLLDVDRKKKVYKIIGFSSLLGIVEFLSILSVLPFMSYILGTQIKGLEYIEKLNVFNIDVGIFISSLFIIFTLASSIGKLILLRFNGHNYFQIHKELNLKYFRNFINQPYEDYIKKSQADSYSDLTKVDVVAGVIQNQIEAVTGIIVGLIVFIGLFITNPQVITLLAIYFLIFYILISKYSKPIFSTISKLVNKNLTLKLVELRNASGGFRNILLNNHTQFFTDKFEEVEKDLRGAQTTAFILGSSPKIIIEAMTFILLAAIVIYMNVQGVSVVEHLPVIGTLMIATIKLLPIVQSVFKSWVIVLANEHVINEIVFQIGYKVDKESSTDQVLFNKTLKVKNLTYNYPIQRGFSLEIDNFECRKGEKIGIVGTTGSGKSTFMDILVGLLKPTKGNVLVDDVVITDKNIKSWQSKISYVSQTLYLANTSIRENIAFGISPNQIDDERIKNSAEIAHIDEFIASCPEGYETLCGDDGISLSGGQKQRIGLARAIYQSAEILVLDEATSSLDIETEKTIMETVYSLKEDITILIIAHRLTTLSGCSKIYEIDKGKIINSGSFNDVVKNIAI